VEVRSIPQGGKKNYSPQEKLPLAVDAVYLKRKRRGLRLGGREMKERGLSGEAFHEMK